MMSKLLLILALYLAHAAGAIAALPENVQPLVDNGILAGKEGRHLAAISDFREALKLAPDSPEIFLCLGVAESKLPGRELRAVAWLSAYRTVLPGAPNAAKVKRQIDELRASNSKTVVTLVQSALKAGKKISNPAYRKRSGELAAEAGDLASALAIASQENEPFDKCTLLTCVVNKQLERSDFNSAIETADAMNDLSWKARTLAAIAQAQQKTDAAAARDTSRLALDAAATLSVSSRTHIMTLIGMVNARAGAVSEAKEILEAAAALAESEEDLYWRWTMLVQVAVAQIEIDDTAGANATLNSGVKHAIFVKDPGSRCRAQTAFAELQLKMGSTEDAKATLAAATQSAEVTTSAAEKGPALVQITELWIKAGASASARTSVAEVLKAASLMDADYKKEEVLGLLVKAQLELGDIADAQAIFKLLSNRSYMSDAQRNIAEAQALAGDIKAAEKTTVSITEASQRCRALAAISVAYALQSDQEKARRSLATAQKVAASVEGFENQQELLPYLALAHAKTGNLTAAGEALAASKKMAILSFIPGYDPTLKLTEEIRLKIGLQSLPLHTQSADWLHILEKTSESDSCPLNSAPFLDLPAYLKSVSSDDPGNLYEILAGTAQKLMKADKVVAQLLEWPSLQK